MVYEEIPPPPLPHYVKCFECLKKSALKLVLGSIFDGHSLSRATALWSRQSYKDTTISFNNIQQLYIDMKIFTFTHLADAFIQYMCSLGIEPTTFCVANAML